MAFAEQAENAWKFMAKQEQNEHKVVKAVVPRPFKTLKAIAFVDVASRRGCKRLIRVDTTLALMGFTHWSHLEGVNCESLTINN